MNFILQVYDYFCHHRKLLLFISICSIITLLSFVVRLHFSEDISDFLPFLSSQKEAMEIYERISGGERIIVIFDGGDTDEKMTAVDSFASIVLAEDSLIASRLLTHIDIEAYYQGLGWIYDNMPYFMQPADYVRLDSILSSPNAINDALVKNLQLLQMPMSSLVQQGMAADPLSLFSPIIASLQHFRPATQGYTTLDGYMMSDDERQAFAIIESPYGMEETKGNARLVKMLQGICERVRADFPNLSVRLLGGPVVAVENASCIKNDSLMTILLALGLICGILFYFFRKDVESILLIVLTIGFGWLCGMAVMGGIFGQMSLIVLGMGSVIIGIAVNYPLHLVVHRHYTSSIRETLQDVVIPLTVGNITTIGAFLTLVPLRALALREMGIFAASSLIGTLVFSLFVLPHLMPSTKCFPTSDANDWGQRVWYNRLSRGQRWAMLAVIVCLTGSFYMAGRGIRFDADISHINYMTPQQRADFAYLSSLMGESETTDIYVVQDISEGTPLDIGGIGNIYSAYRWLPSIAEQQRRLHQWDSFWHNKRAVLLQQFNERAESLGFSQSAFKPFVDLLQREFAVQPFDYFRAFAQTFLAGYWLEEKGRIRLVSRLNVPNEQCAYATATLHQNASLKSANIFDIRSLNASIATQLSANFDYIGIVCSLIVFGLLWVSFRSLKLAIIAFAPMVVSWIWIMGIMHLLGLEFNIVNIILATFIFGQGDDYTIFVVEGIDHEMRTGTPLLRQFRQGILLSASIMFVGMGVLVLSKHPAMFSLGIVTVIGMAVVVLLANILPPLIMTCFSPQGVGKKGREGMV